MDFIKKEKEYFIKELLGKKILGTAGGIAALIASIIITFLISDYSLGICCILLSICFILFTLFHYSKIDKENIEIIKAICFEKRRTGYRKQYFEYDFIIDGSEDTFTLRTSQKGKFNKKSKYVLCFKKTNSINKYNVSSLLSFRQYSGENSGENIEDLSKEKSRNVFENKTGEMYLGTAMTTIIVVVIGALVLVSFLLMISGPLNNFIEHSFNPLGTPTISESAVFNDMS